MQFTWGLSGNDWRFQLFFNFRIAGIRSLFKLQAFNVFKGLAMLYKVRNQSSGLQRLVTFVHLLFCNYSSSPLFLQTCCLNQKDTIYCTTIKHSRGAQRKKDNAVQRTLFSSPVVLWLSWQGRHFLVNILQVYSILF